VSRPNETAQKYVPDLRPGYHDQYRQNSDGRSAVVLRIESIAGDRQPTSLRHRVECVLNNVINTCASGFPSPLTTMLCGPRWLRSPHLSVQQITEESARLQTVRKGQLHRVESLVDLRVQATGARVYQPFYLRESYAKSLAQLLSGIRRAARSWTLSFIAARGLRTSLRHTRDDTTKSGEPFAATQILLQFSRRARLARRVAASSLIAAAMRAVPGVWRRIAGG